MNIHIIIGEDDYLVSSAAKKIVGDGTGLEVIDSLNSTNEAARQRDVRLAEESLLTAPFLDPRKVTWWKNVGFLPGGPRLKETEGADDADENGVSSKDLLERFAEKLATIRLPDNQHFVLTAPKLLMTSKIAKRLKASVEMIVFSPPKPWEAAQAAVGRVEEYAKEHGLALAPGVAEAFVTRVGTDAGSLASEIRKMRDYLGGEKRPVTKADVEAVASPGAGIEASFFAVTDAVGARKAEAALVELGRLENDRSFAVLAATMLEKFFRQLLALKAAEAAGRLAEATEGMAPFLVRKNQGFLRNWTLSELRVARYRFETLRERSVSYLESAGTVVQTELLRCLRRNMIK